MSNFTEGSNLCDVCLRNLQQLATIKVSEIKGRKNGIYIATLNQKQADATTGYCQLCKLLESAKLSFAKLERSRYRSNIPAKEWNYELRAISFFETYKGLNFERTNAAERRIADAINLVVIPDEFEAAVDGRILRDWIWATGNIFYCSGKGSGLPKSLSPSPRVVSRTFNAPLVQSWIQYCRDYHETLCSGIAFRVLPNMSVIDCVSRQIITAPLGALYVTLSYVWGQPKLSEIEEDAPYQQLASGRLLPTDLPMVVEDSMTITIKLGYRYLWVDKYCINQNSSVKHMELRQMDLIYQGSDLTIIQAAGEDEATGLPGVNNHPRIEQPNVTFGSAKIISTMAHPHYNIRTSKWNTRGWTLQESALSRRRLVFTQEQVYFECNAMNCSESLNIPLDLAHTLRRDRFRSFMRAGLFSGRDEGLQDPIFGEPFGSFDERKVSSSFYYRKFLVLATNYTSRDLSFDSDSLNAFLGIVSNFRETKYPLFHIQGIPFISPTIQTDEMECVNSTIAGLCWRHINSCWSKRLSVRRRAQFPSWTWAGWAGAVSWTDVFTFHVMDIKSLVDDFYCETDNQAIISLHELYQQCTDNQHISIIALHMSAWLVPPEMISLHGIEDDPAWKIGKFELQMHISIFHNSPSAFLAALRAREIDCYFVGKGLYNSYFLFLEPRGTAQLRIGTAEAIFFYDNKHRRFADEVDFNGMKQPLRLL
jgi:hypothetical protein